MLDERLPGLIAAAIEKGDTNTSSDLLRKNGSLQVFEYCLKTYVKEQQYNTLDRFLASHLSGFADNDYILEIMRNIAKNAAFNDDRNAVRIILQHMPDKADVATSILSGIFERVANKESKKLLPVAQILIHDFNANAQEALLTSTSPLKTELKELKAGIKNIEGKLRQLDLFNSALGPNH